MNDRVMTVMVVAMSSLAAMGADGGGVPAFIVQLVLLGVLVPLLIVMCRRPKTDQPRFALSNCSIPRAVLGVLYAVGALYVLFTALSETNRRPVAGNEGGFFALALVTVILAGASLYMLFGGSLRATKTTGPGATGR